MAFLKNVAASILNKTAPAIAKNIFVNEDAKIKDIASKFDSAKELLNKKTKEYNETLKSFEGFSKVGKTLSKQVRSGKFGMNAEDQDKLLMKEFGFDMDEFGDLDKMDDMGSFEASFDDADSSSSSETSTESSTDGDVTHNTSNTLNKKQIFVKNTVLGGTGLGKGDVLISEKVAHSTAITASLGAAQISLLGKIAEATNAIASFQNEQMKVFIDASLESFKAAVKFEEERSKLAEPMYEYYAEQKKAREKAATKHFDMQTALLDPERWLQNATMTSDMLLGEDAATTRSWLQQLSQDPLGTMLGYAGGHFATKFFEKGIESVKTQFDVAADRIQNMFESWAYDFSDNSMMGTIKRMVAGIFKVDISRADRASVGKVDLDAEAVFTNRTQKAIVDTIPMYLAKILSAIKKSDDHEIFDYDQNKFVSANSLKKDFIKEQIEIREGMYWGGIGKEGERLAERAGLSKKDGNRFRLALRDLSMSTDSYKFNSMPSVFEELARLGHLDGAALSNVISQYNSMDKKSQSSMLRAFHKTRTTTANKFKRLSDENKFGTIVQADALGKGHLNTRRILPGRDITDIQGGLASEAKEILAKYGIDPSSAAGKRIINDYVQTGNISRVEKAARRYDAHTNSHAFGDKRNRGSSDPGVNGDRDASAGKGSKDWKNPFGDWKGKFGNFGSGIVNVIGGIAAVPLGVLAAIGGTVLGFLRDVGNKLLDWAKDIGKGLLQWGKEKLVGKDRADKLSLKESITTAFDEKVITPVKTWMLKGTSKEDSVDGTSFKESVQTAFNERVLHPIKAWMVGDERAKETGFFKSVGIAFDEKVLAPVKTWMQKGTSKEGETLSFKDSIATAFDEKVLAPVKAWMLKGTSKEDDKNVTFMDSLKTSFNERIILPLKEKLVGKEDAQGMNLFTVMYTWVDKNIFFSLKKSLVGFDESYKVNLFQALVMKAESTIFVPLKKWMTGEKEGWEKETLLSSVKIAFTDKIITPLKVKLVGEERAHEEDMTLLKSMKAAYMEKIIYPLNEHLFGKDKREESFFKNVYEGFKPMLNKIFYGKKAEEFTFSENLKKTWDGLKDYVNTKFLYPIRNTLRETFGKPLKEFFQTIGGEVKHYLSGFKNVMVKTFKEGASVTIKTVFGDNITQMMHEHIVSPLRELTSKLGEQASKMTKLILRLPLNLLKGVTNSIQLQRIKEGRSKLSEAKQAKILALAKENKLFNLLDVGEELTERRKKAMERLSNMKQAQYKRYKGLQAAYKEGGEEAVSASGLAVNSKVKPHSKTTNEVAKKEHMSNSIMQGVKDIGSTLKDKLGKLLESFKEGFGVVKDKVVTYSKEGVEVAKEAWNTTKEKTVPVLQDIGKFFKTTYSKVADKVRETLPVIRDALVSIAQRLGAGISGMASGMSAVRLSAGRKTSAKGNVITTPDGTVIIPPPFKANSATAQRIVKAANDESHSGNGKGTKGSATANEGNATEESILGYLKSIDRKMDILIGAVKDLGVGKGTGQGGGGFFHSFFVNPSRWVRQKLMMLISAPIKLFNNVVGKLAKGVAWLTKTWLDVFGKATSMLTQLGGAAIKAVGAVANTVAKGIVEGIKLVGTVTGEVVKATGTLVRETFSLVGELGKTAVTMMGDLGSAAIKGINIALNAIAPMLDTVAKAAADAAKGLWEMGKFFISTTWRITKGLAEGLMGALGTVWGVLTGKRTITGNRAVHVKNFEDMFLYSDVKPLKVHVVDGKIETYTKKRKNHGINFFDNKENIVPANKEHIEETKQKARHEPLWMNIFKALGLNTLLAKIFGTVGTVIGSIGTFAKTILMGKGIKEAVKAVGSRGAAKAAAAAAGTGGVADKVADATEAVSDAADIAEGAGKVGKRAGWGKRLRVGSKIARRSAGRGLRKVGGMLKGASMLSKGLGVANGVLGAVNVFSTFSEANEALEAGEITKDEANAQKGGAIGGAIGGVAGSILGTFFGPAGTMIGGMLGNTIGEVIGSAIGKSWETIKSILGWVWDKIKAAGGMVWDGIKSAASTVGHWFLLPDGDFDWEKGVFKNKDHFSIPGSILEFFYKPVTIMQRGIKSITSFFNGGGNWGFDFKTFSVTTTQPNVLATALNALLYPMRAMKQGAELFFGKITGVFSNLWGWFKNSAVGRGLADLMGIDLDKSVNGMRFEGDRSKAEAEKEAQARKRQEERESDRTVMERMIDVMKSMAKGAAVAGPAGAMVAATNAVVGEVSTAAGSSQAANAAAVAASRATPRYIKGVNGKCAKFVADALQRSGYKFNRQQSAYMYAHGPLAQMGFSQINPQSPPQPGDIQVWPAHHKTKDGGGIHGHIQIWTGRNWVSDFVQQSGVPGSYYKGLVPTMWRDIRNQTNIGSAAAMQDKEANANTYAPPSSNVQVKVPALLKAPSASTSANNNAFSNSKVRTIASALNKNKATSVVKVPMKSNPTALKTQGGNGANKADLAGFGGNANIKGLNANTAFDASTIHRVDAGVTPAGFGITAGSNELNAVINRVADMHGIPREILHAMAIVESGKNPRATNSGGYTGLMQFGKSAWATQAPTGYKDFRYAYDPAISAHAAANYISYHAALLQKNGFPVTPLNLYGMHQQGAGGWMNMLSAVRNGTPLGGQALNAMMKNWPSEAGPKSNNPRAWYDGWAKRFNSKLGASGGVDATFSGAPVSAAPGGATPAAGGEDGNAEALNFLSAFYGADAWSKMAAVNANFGKIAVNGPASAKTSSSKGSVGVNVSARVGNGVRLMKVEQKERPTANVHTVDKLQAENAKVLEKAASAKKGDTTLNVSDPNMLSETARSNELLEEIAKSLKNPPNVNTNVEVKGSGKGNTHVKQHVTYNRNNLNARNNYRNGDRTNAFTLAPSKGAIEVSRMNAQPA